VRGRGQTRLAVLSGGNADPNLLASLEG
jgi:hypothetical protein